MTRARLLIVAAITLLFVAACGAPAPEQTEDKEKAKALGRDTDATVFDDMIKTEDKARGVENLTLGRKDELDKAMQQAEGTPPPAAGDGTDDTH
jgi:hypothetical protein